MSKISKFSVLSMFSCLFLVTFTACDKDKEQDKANLSLQFEAKFENQPLNLTQYYAGRAQDSFAFNKLNFFIANIQFTTADNQSINIPQEDVYFIDFDNTSSLNISLQNVPVGHYTGIKLGLGVPANLNAKEPGNFGPEHILSDAMHYWIPWTSYVFSRVEGIYKDIDGELGFLYHGGIDDMYQNISIQQDFNITENNNTKKLIIQTEKIFYPTVGRAINVKENNMSHGGTPGTTAYEVGLNIIEALAKSIEMQ